MVWSNLQDKHGTTRSHFAILTIHNISSHDYKILAFKQLNLSTTKQSLVGKPLQLVFMSNPSSHKSQ
jgi:hypothetical protein